MGAYQSTCARDNCGRALIQGAFGQPYASRVQDCSTYQTVTVVPAVSTTTVTAGDSTITPDAPATTTQYTITNSAIPAWAMTACTMNKGMSPSQRLQSACSCAFVPTGTTTESAVTVTMTVPTTTITVTATA